jgi:fumarate hydratase class I
MPEFRYQEMFPLEEGDTPYRKVTGDHLSTLQVDGREVLKVAPEALSLIAAEAMRDIAHLLRPGHLQQLANILDDPEASDNDRFVAFDLLKNANIAAGMVLPGCQDTGTAIVMGYKGQYVWTDGDDAEALSRGISKTYTETNLRYSQMAALDMFNEVNTGTNLPAQIDIYASQGNAYKFLFMAKGGGSANKTFLYQQTRAVLNPDALLAFLDEKIRTLGTAACPPYHLAVVIGGTSAEINLKTVKLASTRYLDTLPTDGNDLGRAFRDPGLEAQVHALTQNMGIGAQFGGKYFCHDVRVIRLPRHGASVPIGIGVSCSADRQVLGKISADGIFLEQLETDPAKYLPNIYYAGPAKTPEGYASGSFGPTTAGRMDSYVDEFMAAGGSMISLAKGNRSPQVREACKKHGGFYLGSIGGPGARLAQDCIKAVDVVAYPELGMEAIWKIEVENFPAFIVVDDKGDDFFAHISGNSVPETDSG